MVNDFSNTERFGGLMPNVLNRVDLEKQLCAGSKRITAPQNKLLLLKEGTYSCKMLAFVFHGQNLILPLRGWVGRITTSLMF